MHVAGEADDADDVARFGVDLPGIRRMFEPFAELRVGVPRIRHRADEVLAVRALPHVAEQVNERLGRSAVEPRHARTIRLVILLPRHAELAGQPLGHGPGPRSPRALVGALSADHLDQLFGVVVLALLVDDVDDHIERCGVLRDKPPVGAGILRSEDDLSQDLDPVAGERLIRHCGEVVHRVHHGDEDLGRS